MAWCFLYVDFFFYLPLLDISEILQTIYQRKTQIPQKLSILEKTLERHIKNLKDAGLVEYRESKKTGGYYIVHDRNASNEGITGGIAEGINGADNSIE